jgi:hypothetical protein
MSKFVGKFQETLKIFGKDVWLLEIVELFIIILLTIINVIIIIIQLIEDALHSLT